MAFDAQQKKTLKQKFRRFLCKATLCGTFAAAVGGAAIDNAYSGTGGNSPAQAINSSAIQETNAEVTVTNTCLADVAQRAPQLYRDLTLMEKLPLTGKAIYSLVENPTNGITSTVFPAQTGETTEGSSLYKNVRIGAGRATTTAFHEYFHAAQNIQQCGNRRADLTIRDAAVDNLLREATAAAYEMVSSKEADLLEVQFFQPAPVTNAIPGGYIVYSSASAADLPENKAVFNAAYEAAWEKNADQKPETRTAKALEAAGKTIVRRLLDGQDSQWKEGYVPQTLANINNNLALFHENGSSIGYEAKRRDIYTKEGIVSSEINLVPDEYLGTNAEKSIVTCFQGMGFISQ